MIKVRFSHNNSHAKEWITEHQLGLLENLGWKHDFFKEAPYKWGKVQRFYESTKEFETPADAINEVKSIVGSRIYDNGCNCCGAPFTFSWKTSETSGKSVSGEGIKKEVGKLYYVVQTKLDGNEFVPDQKFRHLHEAQKVARESAEALTYLGVYVEVHKVEEIDLITYDEFLELTEAEGNKGDKEATDEN